MMKKKDNMVGIKVPSSILTMIYYANTMTMEILNQLEVNVIILSLINGDNKVYSPSKVSWPASIYNRVHACEREKKWKSGFSLSSSIFTLKCHSSCCFYYNRWWDNIFFEERFLLFILELIHPSHVTTAETISSCAIQSAHRPVSRFTTKKGNQQTIKTPEFITVSFSFD